MIPTDLFSPQDPQPPSFSEEALARTEARIGQSLPGVLVEVLKRCNGGALRHDTLALGDHVLKVHSLFGVHGGRTGIAARAEVAWTQGFPRQFVVVGSAADGWLGLQYPDPPGAPSVWLARRDGPRMDGRQLADDVEQFLGGLQVPPG